MSKSDDLRREDALRAQVDQVRLRGGDQVDACLEVGLDRSQLGALGYLIGAWNDTQWWEEVTVRRSGRSSIRGRPGSW